MNGPAQTLADPDGAGLDGAWEGERRVLIVDDDVDFTESLADLLTLDDCAIAVAHDPDQAIAVAAAFDPQVALIDVQLGAKTGLDVITLLRQRHLDIICVLITAHATIDTTIKALRTGAYDYLSKPLRQDELLAVLGRCYEKLYLRRRKQAAETALQLTHGRLLDAVEAMSEGFVLFDSDDRMVLCNSRYREMCHAFADLVVPGVRFEDLVRAGLECGRFPDADGRAEDWLRERLEKHRDPAAPYEERRPGDRWFRIEERVTGDGGYVGIRADITEAKRAEQALRASETRLRTTIENAPLILWTVDREGRFTLVGGQGLKSMNLKAADLLGKSAYHAFAAFSGLAENLDAAMAGQERTFMSVADRTAFNHFLAPLPAPDGGFAGVIGVSTDITERWAIEEQLRQAQKMEAVGQLTGGIAHDFNNLLTVVLGNVELLAERLAGDAKKQKLALNARQAALRGASLTDRLLAYSRKQQLRPQSIDVNALVNGLIEMLRRTLGETIEVDAVAGDDLWNCLADPAGLESTLLNLAINARDAMPDGGRLTIEMKNTYLDDAYASAAAEVEPGNYVMLSVTDTGTGMTAETAARAFEPFFTTKQAGVNSGLGLSMVYGFAKQSGGHVNIYSEIEHGTAVKVYLPVAEMAPSVEPGDTFTVERSDLKPTILVVEDDLDVRTLAVTLLGDLGYHVLEAKDGPTALSELDRNRKIDLLFTDVVLPNGMNGRDLADEAQRHRPGIKVIFTSGYTDNIMVRDGRLDPDVILIAKPYRKIDLARRIGDALHGNRS